MASMRARFVIACGCDFLPECYMASTAIRERRRTLRYRNLLVRQMVQMKIKISSLLMEAGVSYNKERFAQSRLFPRTAGHQPRHRRRFALAARPVPGNGGAARQDRRRAGSLPAERSIAGRT